MTQKTAQIKTTIGTVVTLLNKAIEHHRVKMTYGGEKVLTEGSAFRKVYKTVPMEKDNYWPVMLGFYPWNQLGGVFSAACVLPADTEMWISVELAGALGQVEVAKLQNKGDI